MFSKLKFELGNWTYYVISHFVQRHEIVFNMLWQLLCIIKGSCVVQRFAVIPYVLKV